MNKEVIIKECDFFIKALEQHLKDSDREQDGWNFDVIYEEYASLLRRIKYFLTLHDQTKIYRNDCERLENRFTGKPTNYRENRRRMLLEGYKEIVAGYKEAVSLYT